MRRRRRKRKKRRRNRRRRRVLGKLHFFRERGEKKEENMVTEFTGLK
jgi:hypothetical protein